MAKVNIRIPEKGMNDMAHRRSILALIPAVVCLAGSLPAPARAGEEAAAAQWPAAYAPLPLGSIKPRGWLREQLQIQAEGLSGHLDEFWPDIKDSAWIGGKAEGWERTPYWLDGLVPLAYLLDDPALKAKVKRYIDYILDHQAADGWLGPVGDNDPKHKPYDVWPLFVLFKALTQYQEATGDPRVVPAMLKCCKKIDQVITKEPLSSWAHYRAADLVVSLAWLHDRTGEEWLLALADKVLAQAYDWRKHFEDFEPHREKATKFDLRNHGVNNGMALKFGPVRWRRTADLKDRAAPTLMLAELDRYHGQATGIFTCDEHYAGRSPSQGTELCTVAEAMYSLEVAAAINKDYALGDRLEKLAFNAFPATFKKDMCAHQYDQQANQVVCKIARERVYTNNNEDSNLYGLEPNFGCCTANMHQGWPKFTEHLWLKSTGDPHFLVLAYAPCLIETEVRGEKVRIRMETNYPFDGTVRVRAWAAKLTDVWVDFRLPGWLTEDPTIEILGPGGMPRARIAYRGEYHASVIADPDMERTWILQFPMNPRLREGFQGAVSIERGPLVYALKVDGAWKKVKGKEPFADWEVYPKTPWNYALQLDPADLKSSVRFEARGLRGRPFSPDGAPIVARVTGRRLPGWTLEKNAAAPPPQSPVSSDEPPEGLTLIPYGCTDLRVTEFPVLKRD